LQHRAERRNTLLKIVENTRHRELPCVLNFFVRPAGLF
jgi:hypothetical protein